jgi:hypothetical protein
MNVTILLDHDLEGLVAFIQAGLLASIIIDLENYLGTGRVFLP